MAHEMNIRSGLGDVDRTCPGCGGNNDHATFIGAGGTEGHDPRHVIVGVGQRLEQATLANGQPIQVNVPVDEAWHFDCHATVGCEHCADMLAAHAGSVKGKGGGLKTPKHLADVTANQFDVGANGVLTKKKG